MIRRISIILAFAAVVVMMVGCTSTAGELATDIYDGSTIYEVDNTTEHNAVVYKPRGLVSTRGIIIYVGTFIEPAEYENISKQLAMRGYYVALPRVSMNMTYMSYQTKEIVLDNNNIQFVVGGHSQGGGAAVRRLSEEQYKDKMIGGVFLSPLTYNRDTLSDSSMPALLIEAENDSILTQEMKANAKETMPKHVQSHMIVGGNHMGYCDMAMPMDGKLENPEMQSITAELILDFLGQLSWSK